MRRRSTRSKRGIVQLVRRNWASAAATQLDGYCTELRQIAQGVALTREDQRSHACARHGERRTDGHRDRVRGSCARRDWTSTWWDARTDAAWPRSAAMPRRGQLAVGHLRFRAGSPNSSHGCSARARRHHAGLHRQRCRRRHRAAGPRRFGHLRRRISPPNCAHGGWRSGPTCPACSAPIPRSTPTAAAAARLHYDEAQEIASSGAKVLHPRCVMPVRVHRIPLYVYATQAPDLEGTHIVDSAASDARPRSRPCASRRASRWCRWKAPACGTRSASWPMRSRSSSRMGMSVDLVSTSETNVTVSLDPQANTLDRAAHGRR